MTTRSSKPSESYPNKDYEWYACDAAGQVAVFTTAGVGPIPSVIIASLPVADSLCDAVRKMKARGKATMLISLPRPDDFIHFASCGFFAYDWQDVHRARNFSRRYEMLSRPDIPIHVSEMPEQFQPLLRGVMLAGVRFADSPTIDIRAHFDCKPVA